MIFPGHNTSRKGGRVEGKKVMEVTAKAIQPETVAVPIVLTAFGTTTRAWRTYTRLEERIRQVFPGHPIHWAFTSRLVVERLAQERRRPLPRPLQVLAELQRQGHTWAVVQSLHLLAGHEFYRLLDEILPGPLRLSIGLPLLSSPADYERLAAILLAQAGLTPGQALVLVGHGTDHPAWATYPALEAICRQLHGPGVYVGVVDGYPGQEEVIPRVVRDGWRRVKLVPLLLVAGRHFLEDLTQEDDSWQAALTAAGLEVEAVDYGLGELPGVSELVCDHIREALAVMPTTCSRTALPGFGTAPTLTGKASLG